MDFSLFDEASRDYEQEARERRTAMVRTAVVQEVMPFVGLATSTEEYVHRKALAAQTIQSISMRYGSSWDEVAGVADRLYGLMTEARRQPDDGLTFVANAMACGNCGHQSTDHTEGLRCSCGCTDFTPDTTETKQAMRREAGEGSGPFS